MRLLRSFFETIALFLLCVLAFLVAFFVLPFLYQGASDGLLMTIWNLFMANFFGLSYWHLTDLKADGFLPNANSYALILILAAFGVAAVPMGFFVDSEWWETLYTIAQAGGACFVAYLAVQHRTSTLSDRVDL